MQKTLKPNPKSYPSSLIQFRRKYLKINKIKDVRGGNTLHSKKDPAFVKSSYNQSADKFC